jgi:carboxyl-terminal processing protease
MKTVWRRLAALFLIMILLGVGIGAGIVLDHQANPAQAAQNAPANAPDFQLISEAWNIIQREYVDPSAQQTKPLTYGAIGGMVNALGDTGHSSFLSPEMVKSQHDYTRGQFEGIGAEVETKDGHTVIVAPLDNSPAQKAGIHAGEIILKVDGTDVTDLPLDQVVGRILGPAGTRVTVTVLDPKTGKTTDHELTRARITMQNVTWQKLPGTNIAHLRIAGFSQGVTRELGQALTDMQRQGVAGIILDLRNNPGGLLNEAVGTASQFLSSGDVLQEKDAKGRITHDTVRPGGLATDLPMVVLINRGSASASEIVAGALQDTKRATLVGDTTFGTGTVLNEFPLSDGSALMLAVKEWLTPSGRAIWHKGITPDEAVTLASDATPLTPEGERALTADQLKASTDQQLLKGLGLLNRSALNNSSSWTAPAALTAAPDANAGTVASWLALDLELLKYHMVIQ